MHNFYIETSFFDQRYWRGGDGPRRGALLAARKIKIARELLKIHFLYTYIKIKQLCTYLNYIIFIC